jgi:ribonuclease P protein component
VLAREHRLRSRDGIREVVKDGKRFSNRIATIHFLTSDQNQFAVVASKAVGNAVLRNKAKRRARSALLAHQTTEPAIRAVFRLRSAAATASWSEFEAGILELVGKAK